LKIYLVPPHSLQMRDRVHVLHNKISIRIKRIQNQIKSCVFSKEKHHGLITNVYTCRIKQCLSFNCLGHHRLAEVNSNMQNLNIRVITQACVKVNHKMKITRRPQQTVLRIFNKNTTRTKQLTSGLLLYIHSSLMQAHKNVFLTTPVVSNCSEQVRVEANIFCTEITYSEKVKNVQKQN